MKDRYELWFYQDVAHGWLQVPRELIEELNIQGEISSYSYMDEHNVYLEEDSDLGKFMRAMEVQAPDTVIAEETDHYNRRCWIRRLPRYFARFLKPVQEKVS